MNKKEEIKKDNENMTAYFLLFNKQYFGKKGTVFYTDHIKANEGDSIVSDKVMIVADEIGRPYIPNATVNVKVLKHGKKKKVRLVKFISQKRHKRWKNYRTKYTKLEITDISWPK